MTIATISWRDSLDCSFSVLTQKDTVIVSVTDTPSPALIAVHEDGEDKILLGDRNAELSMLMLGRLSEVFFPNRVVGLLGFRDQLTLERVKQIVDEVAKRFLSVTSD